MRVSGLPTGTILVHTPTGAAVAYQSPVAAPTGQGHRHMASVAVPGSGRATVNVTDLVWGWAVADMDDGVLRRTATRAQAVGWWLGYCGTRRVLQRNQYGGRGGNYEYVVGEPGDTESAFILSADRLGGNGWRPEQVPLYPYPDRLYDEANRGAG